MSHRTHVRAIISKCSNIIGFRNSHILVMPNTSTSSSTTSSKAFSTETSKKNNTMASEAFANNLLEYLNESCTAFHAVEAAKARLIASNFTQVNESERWDLTRGGKYFFTRNTTTIVAFTVGGAYEPGNGFTVAGAHTDR